MKHYYEYNLYDGPLSLCGIIHGDVVDAWDGHGSKCRTCVDAIHAAILKYQSYIDAYEQVLKA